KSRLSASLVQELAGSPDGLSAQVIPGGDFARPTADAGEDEFLSCDFLALEDVQHLTPAAAEELCDVLDRRASRRLATLVTASAGPAQLAQLPQRLTSRLSAGLVVPLAPLAATSRREILAEAARAKGVKLTAEAIDWLAEQSTGGGVRATLGLLQNLAQVAKAFPGPLALRDVRQTLAETGQPTSSPLTVSGIVEHVARAFGITAKELLGASRLRGVLRSRQVAMFLARELTRLSLPRLGAAFGRDHTTVLHACRKIEAEVQIDPVLAKRVSDLRAVLG
ncbi:MAG: hypothetical protein K2V38_06920, partial [Gemmataceae bacterium]|nr:hypothetical protein [Gemmataceae bacterium]